MSNATKKKYGTGHLIFDVFMCLITGGLWLIVIVIKYLRRNS